MQHLLKSCWKPANKSVTLLKSSQKLKVASLHTGQSVEVKRTVTPAELQQFIDLSGDSNEVHSQNPAVIHGAFLNGLVSGVIGTKLPGHGTLLLEQTLRFPNPCYVNEEITIKVTIESVKRIVTCSFICNVLDCKNGSKTVLKGNAKLLCKKDSELE